MLTDILVKLGLLAKKNSRSLEAEARHALQCYVDNNGAVSVIHNPVNVFEFVIETKSPADSLAACATILTSMEIPELCRLAVKITK